MKKCPYCAEEIQDEAVVCKHCGRDLTPTTQPTVPPLQEPKKSPSRKVLLAGIVVLICICVGLAGVFNRQDAEQTDIKPTETSEAEKLISAETPVPTLTPAPTDTPLPTFTSTPLPEPLIFTGSGNSVVDVNKWDGPALAVATYRGGSNFIVRNYGENNSELGLVFNGLRDYQGTVMLDIDPDENTERLQVDTTGDWVIELRPMKMATVVEPPFSYQGRDDDVLWVKGGIPDLLKYQATDSNFVIYAYGSEDAELVVNDIGPATGTTLLPSDTFLLVVNGSGAWSIEVTAK